MHISQKKKSFLTQLKVRFVTYYEFATVLKAARFDIDINRDFPI